MSLRLRTGSHLSSVGQAAVAIIGNASIGIKLVCFTVLLGYGLSFSETAVDALSVTPGYFWPPHYYFWTAFTHCYLELHWWDVVIDVLTLIFVGKLLEPLWGALEMVTFFVVVNFSVALTCSIFYYVLFAISQDAHFLFDVHIHGLAGYLAGVSVAVKQAMPDHILYRSPIMGLSIKFTNRNIPLTVLLVSLVLWAVGLVEGSYCSMFASGLVTSWIYLRFYQVHANGSRGDIADGFAFASFFPNVMQPPVAATGNALFGVLVKLRMCRRPVRCYDVGPRLSGPSSISISLPPKDGVENNQDTERRRQIALKALSDRLGKSSIESAATWPTLENDDDPPQEGDRAMKKPEEQSPPEKVPDHVSVSVPPLPDEPKTPDQEQQQQPM